MSAKAGNGRTAKGPIVGPTIVRVEIACPVDLEIRLHAASRKLGVRKADLCVRLIDAGLRRYAVDKAETVPLPRGAGEGSEAA